MAKKNTRSRRAGLVTALGMLVAMAFALSFALSACTAAAQGGGTTSPTPSGSATSASAAVLTSYDWASVTLPASSCDPAATGDIVLTDGKGTVTVNATTSYAVTVMTPPDIGEVAGRPAAVLRYSCVLVGSNGVGAFPIAVFVADAKKPELAGILQNSDLGVTPNGSALNHNAVSFVDGQIVVTGKYLTDGDARCCASGIGWTSIAFVYGGLVALGSIVVGAPPATLPPRGARISGTLIVYDPAVRVQKKSDLGYLAGAPQDFKDFVWNQRQQANVPGCDSVISVSRLSLAGFALGDEGCVPPMGGEELLWVKHGGQWHVLMGLQNTPSCDALKAANFPAEVLGDDPQCRDAAEDTVPYAG
jgi:hypothetical protein